LSTSKKYQGTIILSNISIKDKRSDWAYYLSPNRLISLGFLVELKFLDHFFRIKKMNKLNCEVLEFNKNVIKLHNRFGFEIEGQREEHIFRESHFVDSALLGLNKKTWDIKKENIFSKYLVK